MLDSIFSGIFDEGMVATISISKFLLCIAVSLVIGLFLAFAYTLKNKNAYSKSFVVTIATIPAVVCVVIMMVNGNIGAGVAVAGAFSLVRFRSAPGTAKEISAIFIAMGAGLIAGMGYLSYAVLFTLILGIINIIYDCSKFGDKKINELEKELRITIPEDLNYTDVFDDLFESFTDSHRLVDVKTTNMGSMYKLRYSLKLKDLSKEKLFIDELRCRNGNLEIGMSVQNSNHFEL